MAKSKAGGTRTYLRGRVGSDVYSIGRDSKGKKQQVVRSLAESVSNPQTTSQMRGRMILSTLAQAMAALRPVIDHSFDNVIGAQANLSEFTSRNYALIKADVAANPSSGNKFGLNAYQEKGAKQGCYIISDGQAVVPAALVLTPANGVINITMPSDRITFGGLKAALGMTSEEYFTLVGLKNDGTAAYERFRVNPTQDADTAISSTNIGDVFAVEGNATASISIASNVITITLADVAGCCAVIVSKKADGKYLHNKAVLGDGADFAVAADIALPTYPVGAQNYLNGGDIFGMEESFNPGEDPGPAPSPTQSRIGSVSVHGANLSKSGSVQLNEGANAVIANIVNGTDGSTYAVAAVNAASAVIGQSVAAGDQHAVSGSSVSFSVTGSTSDTAKRIVLVRDNVISEVWGQLSQPVAPVPGDDPALSDFRIDGQSFLDENQEYNGSPGAKTFTYAGQNLTGSYMAISTNRDLSVGATLNISSITGGAAAQLSANSGSTQITIPGGQTRFYLVQNNLVKARLAASNALD